MELEQLREITSEFEKVIESAFKQKYLQYPSDTRERLLNINPVRRWHLEKFLDTYKGAGCYPSARLEKLIYKLFDIKLQLYYIHEVDLGLYNRLVYDCGYDEDNPLALSHVFLTRLSLDQSLIAKSRILWERIMNFVFYLETGEELEEKVSGRKSKRKLFFGFTRSSLRWRFLEPYEAVLQEYEDSYRTPEFHKNSVLRVALLSKRNIDLNKLLDLVNLSMNIIWENIISIVGGGKAQRFSELHASAEHVIDPRYLE